MLLGGLDVWSLALMINVDQSQSVVAAVMGMIALRRLFKYDLIVLDVNASLVSLIERSRGLLIIQSIRLDIFEISVVLASESETVPRLIC